MAIKKYTVSRDDSIYEAWPDLLLTKSGKLICVFNECVHHANRDKTRIAVCESLDRGRTWSQKRYCGPETSSEDYWNSIRISQLKDGRIVILCDWIEKAEELGANMRLYMWISSDDGYTWGEGRELPIHGFTSSKLIELSSGRWVIAIADFFKCERRRAGIYVYFSDDAGKTWSERKTMVQDPEYVFIEPCLLEMSDGSIAAFLRENSGKGLDCFKAFSHDGGETWDGVYKMPLPGCHRPAAGYLNSGKIMISYRHHQGCRDWLGYWTQNLFTALTDERSVFEKERKGQNTRIMPVDYDGSAVSDTGYSAWVQFEDGEIYMVNYIVADAPKAFIRGYSFYEEDFFI